MANTFITQSMLDRFSVKAGIILNARLIMAALIQNSIRTSNVSNSGGSAKVTYVPRSTATRIDGRLGLSQLSAGDVTEEEVDINLMEYLYDQKTISTTEQTFEIGNFERAYILPMAAGIAKGADSFLMNRAFGGLAKNTVGEFDSNPTTAAHVRAAKKALIDQLGPDVMGEFVSGTDTWSALSGTVDYGSLDYGSGPTAVERATLINKYNLRHLTSQHAGGDFDPGTLTGTVLVNGASQTGTSLVVDGFSSAQRYINRGTRLTVNSEIHTLAQDVLVSATGTATLVLNAALASSPADDAAVTFAQSKVNFAMVREAMAGAIIAPPPQMGMLSSTQKVGDISVRVTMEGSMTGSSGPASTITMDTFAGGEIVNPDLGCQVGGA